jgi:hypothetical protein
VTRNRHISIFTKTITKAMAAGFTLEQGVVAAVDKFLLAIELEQEESESGVMDREPIPIERNFTPRASDNPRNRPDMDISDALKPPIPGAEGSQERSIIIDPSTPLPDRAPPIRISPGSTSDISAAPKRYWKQSDLSDWVLQMTSDIIHVPVEGRINPVILTRNVEVLAGIDMVRLSYGLPDRAMPSPSTPNSRGGEPLTPLMVDAPVFVNISAFERNIDMDSKMEQIFSQASMAFKPKPKSISSTTPIRSGSITFSDSDPHDSVGLTPGVNGKLG